MLNSDNNIVNIGLMCSLSGSYIQFIYSSENSDDIMNMENKQHIQYKNQNQMYRDWRLMGGGLTYAQKDWRLAYPAYIRF